MCNDSPKRPSISDVFGADYIAPDLKILQNLNVLIEKNYKHQKAPDYYCNCLNISLKRLNRLVDLYHQRTVYQHIQYRVFMEAERLLRHTTLTAREISFELGLCDQAYLCRKFKRITGMTPIEFRKKYQVLVLV